MISSVFGNTIHTTQSLINTQKFYKNIVQPAATTFVAASCALLFPHLGMTLGSIYTGAAVMQVAGLAYVGVGGFFEKKIKTFLEIQQKFDKVGNYFAAADCEGWTNLAITNKKGIEHSTKRIIKGDNPAIISNEFTIEALLKELPNTNSKTNKPEYMVVGSRIQEEYWKVFNKINDYGSDSSGAIVCANEIIDDQPIQVTGNNN